ncbi:MAG: MFS transporter [Cyanobacteria bacterium]|nr:MFS transporter [Cyanobacteriota bacterium]
MTDRRAITAADRRRAMTFILCMGLVSLFADMTYEGAHGTIGPLMTGLGASVTAVAIVAGFGEMIAAGLRFFSGRLADRTHAYWTLAITGYVLNLLSIPLLAFVTTWQQAAVLIIIERTGKAVRGPARDLLLSEATGKVGHGFGFGVHTVMDQTGACAGPLLMAIIAARTGNLAIGFAWLAIPAALALLSILLARAVRPVRVEPPPAMVIPKMPAVFRPYVAAAGLLAFGFVDFPVLAAHFETRKTFAPATIPLLYSAAMAMTGLTAFIFGKLFDKYGISMMSLGILISLLALPLGFFGGVTGGILAVLCWATGLGVQDACLRAGIAQVVSMNKRGTAFGTFSGVFGVAWFAGSALMGVLYGVSVFALVALGVAAQLIAAGMFFGLRRQLAAAAAAS